MEDMAPGDGHGCRDYNDYCQNVKEAAKRIHDFQIQVSSNQLFERLFSFRNVIPREREYTPLNAFWTPAFTGVTGLRTFSMNCHDSVRQKTRPETRILLRKIALHVNGWLFVQMCPLASHHGHSGMTIEIVIPVLAPVVDQKIPFFIDQLQNIILADFKIRS